MTAPLPANEPGRLQALYDSRILDTPPESDYDDITHLAASVCKTPIAALSFIDDNRQWLKSRYGLDVPELPRDIALCAWCILDRDGIMVLADAADDPRFANNPLVIGEPHIRFYAGVPLVTEDGHAIGALCVADRKPRTLTARQREVLMLLARQAALQIELRRQLADKRRTEEALRESEERFRRAFDDAPVAKALVDPDGRWMQVNPAFCRMIGYSADELLGKTYPEITHPADVAPDAERMERCLRGEADTIVAEKRYIHRDGHTVWALVSVSVVRDAEGNILYFVGEIQDITERKRTEAILERYRLLAEIPRDMILFVDTDARIIEANTAACAGYGYSREELLGRCVRELRAPGTSDTEMDAAIAEAIKTGVLVQATHRRRDGSTFPVEISAQSVRLGDVDIAIDVIRDVSVRKRVEMALRESENRYRSVLNSVQEVIFQRDVGGAWTFLNPAWTELTGYSVAESLGRPFIDFVHPEDRERNLSILDRLFRRDVESYHHEVRYLKRDGASRWVEVFARLMTDEKGGIIGTSGSLRDVTERHQIEEALRESNRRTRQIIETASDCIVSIDSKGRILDINPAAERTFGYCRDEVIGHHVEEFVIIPWLSGVRRSASDEFVLKGISPPINTRLELMAYHADGHEFPIEVTISRSGLDGDSCFTAFARDITTVKEAQESLARALAQAEDASRMKSEFVAAISHELRTPLNGVIGMTGLLLDTNLTPTQREFAETARHSSEVLLALINDLLDFSKIEAGKLSIEPVSFDLCYLVESLGDTFAPRAEAAGVALVIRYDPKAPRRLVGDPGRIRQVVMNLVDNAIKFTHAGHVLVDVECLDRTEEEARLRVRVVDTGIGIHAEHLKRIFDTFTQADASTTRRYGGTGLGLSISRRLAGLMGGTLDVKSRPGEGSTFTLTLTLPLSSDTHVAEPPLPPCRVLVADDNTINRRILQEYMRSWNLSCTSSASAPEALAQMRAAAAEGHPFDVVFVDYRMPEMDGAEMACIIRSEPSLSPVRLVLLTSADRVEAERLPESPFDAVLQRPVRQQDLRATLSRLFSSLPSIPLDVQPSARLPETTAALSARSQGPTWRVLVAEDNAVNQRVAEHILGRLNCRVDVAANGREALEMAQMCSYDVIFMDCSMPEMDGFEATAAIRRYENQQDPHKHTPIIALTASAMVGDRERCLDAGMDGYLAKPVRPEDFAAVVDQFRASADAAARSGPAPSEGAMDAAPAWSGGPAGAVPEAVPEAEDEAEREAWSIEAAEAAEPVDVAALFARTGTDSVFLAGMVETATTEAESLLAQVGAAAQEMDFPEVARFAHALKGMFLTLEAGPAANAARDLERAAWEKDTAGLEDRLHHMRAQAAAALSALLRLHDRLG